MGNKAINLSECQEFSLRNVTLKVYPASLDAILAVEPQLKKLETQTNLPLKEQLDMLVDLIYTLTTTDNPDVQKEVLRKSLNMKACVTIIQAAIGDIQIENAK